MTLSDYKEKVGLDEKTQSEQAKYICYYQMRENNISLFSMADINNWFIYFGYRQINSSRLKNSITKGKNKKFIISKTDKDKLEFVPICLEVLNKELTVLWNDTETVISDSELLDETKFCGKKTYLNKIIKQINCCYNSNCYDACAVMLRRLFEIILILCYENNHIEDAIKTSDGKYKMLERIVADAVSNTTLRISKRICDNFDTFRNIGNFSAHNITYIAGKKDIDDIKLAYRVMLEDLYNKAGLL